jgi:hypothetical protein
MPSPLETAIITTGWGIVKIGGMKGLSAPKRADWERKGTPASSLKHWRTGKALKPRHN